MALAGLVRQNSSIEISSLREIIQKKVIMKYKEN